MSIKKLQYVLMHLKAYLIVQMSSQILRCSRHACQFNRFDLRPRRMHALVHFSLFSNIKMHTHIPCISLLQNRTAVLIKYIWKSLFVEEDHVRLVIVACKRAFIVYLWNLGKNIQHMEMNAHCCHYRFLSEI